MRQLALSLFLFWVLASGTPSVWAEGLTYERAEEAAGGECSRFAFSATAVTLFGHSDAACTVAVRVAGEEAAWFPSEATWEARVELAPGRNEILVEAVDESSVVRDRLAIPIVRYDSVRPVSGVLSSEPAWSESGGPYYINGNVIVPAGVILRIEAGTTVFLDQDATITVQGGLWAEGTPEARVWFLPWRCERWGIIGALGAEGPLGFDFCEFQYAGESAEVGGSVYSGAVSFTGLPATMNRCVFRNCLRCISARDGAELTFRSSLVERNREGISIVSSHAVIEDSTFSTSSGAGEDSINFSRCDTLPYPVVRRCLLLGGEDDGVDMNSSSGIVEDCLITGYNAEDGKGFSLGGPTTPVLRRNLVYDCSVGVAIKDSCEPTLDHLTLVDNAYGVHSYETYAGQGGGAGRATSSIVWNNGVGLLLEDQSTLDVSYSDVDIQSVSGEGVRFGPGNISIAPKFLDASVRDYRLRPDSPCVGTGEGGTDMGALPSQISPAPTPTPTGTVTMSPTPVRTPLPHEPGDVNGDRTINGCDLFDFSRMWQRTGEEAEAASLRCNLADADNSINVEDLLLLLEEWAKD